MNKQVLVNKIVEDFIAGNTGIYEKVFKTRFQDISCGGYESTGFLMKHIPSGEEHLIAYSEDDGYFPIGRDIVRNFIDKFC